MFVRMILALFLLEFFSTVSALNLLHSFSQEFKDKIVNTLLHLYKRIFWSQNRESIEGFVRSIRCIKTSFNNVKISIENNGGLCPASHSPKNSFVSNFCLISTG